MTKHGMLHYFSYAYTPQQNSVVEHKHHHLLNVARALLYQSNIHLPYWSDCLITTTFLINRLPSSLLDHVSPFEKLEGKSPDYTQFKTFRSLCYALILLKDKTKFSPRVILCIFLGYSVGYKGYTLIDLESQNVFISRNVFF